MSLKRFVLASICVSLLLGGCGQPAALSSGSPPFSPPLVPATFETHKVDHVVVIIQENRSVDNLFHGLPGADTVSYGKSENGKKVALAPISLIAPYDLSHRHNAFETEYDHGKMDGFNRVASSVCHRGKGLSCPHKVIRAYGYVPRWEVLPYFTMAEEYGFADRMFQSNQGPSFPAHQYLLGGTSAIAQGSPLRAAENPRTPKGLLTGGCDSPQGSLVWVIDPKGVENEQVFPCFKRVTLPALIEQKSLTWRYYGYLERAGLWQAPDAILQLRDAPGYFQHVVDPPSKILNDIHSGELANVVWVTPTIPESDHAGGNDGTGPAWVGTVVNAIGRSRYWSDTVILVVWDDWGGWYDHVPPPIYNSYELGFRVPLIVISPYVKRGYVSHRRYEFGSILKYIEKTFDLGSLGSTDGRANNLSGFFDYNARARAFVPIRVPVKESYFLNQPLSAEGPVDDDF